MEGNQGWLFIHWLLVADSIPYFIQTKRTSVIHGETPRMFCYYCDQTWSRVWRVYTVAETHHKLTHKIHDNSTSHKGDIKRRIDNQFLDRPNKTSPIYQPDNTYEEGKESTAMLVTKSRNIS